MAWADTRKHITFTCPNGHRCRDSSLHDETFLKENLVALFIYRQATGFCPRTLEPDEGWMIEAVNGLVRLQVAEEQCGPSASAFTAHMDRQQTAPATGNFMAQVM